MTIENKRKELKVNGKNERKKHQEHCLDKISNGIIRVTEVERTKISEFRAGHSFPLNKSSTEGNVCINSAHLSANQRRIITVGVSSKIHVSLI